MKTKSLFVMFAAIGMMLATSCSNDEQVVQSGDEVKVTFSLGLESSMNTRAISDGTGINQLYYAIFDSENTKVASTENQEIDNFPHNQPITLVKGQEYTAVFWAWNENCNAYTISDDGRSVTVDYEDALNNDETRDAFFKSVTFKVTDNTTIDVVLKRAFAQLNVGMTKTEWNAAVNQGKEIEKSKVVIKQAATTLNLIDGSVGGAQDITFSANAIPSEELKVDVNCDGYDEEYKYLSMCYFLVNDTESGAHKTTTDLEFTFFSADDEEIATLEDGLDNAPVQRNHRTNIISSSENGGGIIAGNIMVKVSLDPLYDGEHTLTDKYIWEEYAGIYTEEALAGKTIEIPAGWHIRNGYILEPLPEQWNEHSTPLYTESYTIDGNGNTVTFEPYEYNFVAKNAFAAINGELVTIKNIKFAGEHSGVFGGVHGGKDNNFNVVFENVQIIDNAIYCYNNKGVNPISAFSNLGKATLNNCIIKGTYWVGADKDKDNEDNHVTNALTNYGVFDVFVPNSGTNIVNNSEIGSIYIAEHGNLTLSGTTIVDEIKSPKLVKGTITIKNDTKVTTVDVDQHSDSYPPKVTIESGATIETLQLNSIIKTNINIDKNATIGKIIWKNNEYTSIEDFNKA